MFKVKVLNQEVIKETLGMKEVIEAVEKVYTLKAEEKADVWPMIFHEFEPGVADMDIKSGYLKDADIYGLKLVSWYGENNKKELPPLIGTTLVFDMKTGVPIGLLSAEHITGMRTGAAGAIGAKYLANEESESFLMVGTGHQAPFQIAAMLMVMNHIKKVRLYDPVDFEKAKKLEENIKDLLEEKFLSYYKENEETYISLKKKFDVSFEAVENLEDAVKKSEIITTATPSKKPMIMKEWVSKGTHISCVGADMSGKQEIDENIFSSAKVFVDDINQAKHVGETEIAIKKGVIQEGDILGEIGELILGNIKGRNAKEDITVYDTTGIALQDLMVSKLALDLAKEKGIGEEILL
ncbi:MAG: ornithine cyclodeaminase family protein [Marinisporobacter sp.]|jgi:ornithine cyclodeaminase/alanine dehydrogenase|nr:ornithine cyclodeaminase family protein [Marinisporobacter sp.]